MEKFDVTIVGASVSGSRTAELIASKGYRVALVEEHEKIGRPLKCAGLVSWRLLELLPDLPRKIIINKVSKAKFFSPSGKFFMLESKKPVYVINRERLDRFLAQRAVKNGVEIKTLTKFLDLKYVNNLIKVKTSKGNLKTKLLIGADGANSKVARLAGIKQPNNILFGIQATVDGNFDSDSVELWLGSSIAPDFFAWVIPENENRARVGLATDENPLYFFKKFLKKRVGVLTKPDTAGLLKLGLMKETVSQRVLLVGDAACQLKPFSGGGVVYSLIASEICAGACCKALESEKFDKSSLKNFYEKIWKKVLGKGIKTGMFYRAILSKLSDQQLDLLFNSLKCGKNFLERLDMDFL